MIDARVAHVVARHERSLMRVARHWSLCRDDALDAFQRALEIYVRRIDDVDPATEISWLRVVVKHEALAIRRQRSESVAAEEIDLDGRAPESQRPVDELLAARERVHRGAEALRHLKPDEAKALMLKAEGHSYREISEQLGWTYTKTNRAITEGRARFLKVFAEIEAGAECDRVAPTLAALVDGTATAEALIELRPHLQHCTTCRSTVRKLHESRLGRLAALWPVPVLLAPLRWVGGRIGQQTADPSTVIQTLDDEHETIELSPVEGMPDLPEAIRRIELPDLPKPAHPERFFDLKLHLYQWWHRLQGSDVATSAQLAAANSGGGRIATIGAIIGICLSGVGAVTVCGTLLIAPAVRHDATDRAERVTKPPSRDERTVGRHQRLPTRAEQHLTAPATRTALRESTPVRRNSESSKRTQGQRQSKEHEVATASPPPANVAPNGNSEFDPSYSQSAPSPPAQAPAASGGTEFF